MKTKKKRGRPVEGTTCFKEHKNFKVDCKRKECPQFQKGCKHNCVLISASENELTLQQIGDIFGVTRMRICQIEKIIIKKMKKISNIIDI